MAITRSAVLVPCLMLAVATNAAAQQGDRPEAAGSDTIPRYDLQALVVSVLGAPVSVARSAYPISVVGEADLREGKTGMFLEEALQGLPGVQVQNRFNYAVGERVTIRGFGSRAQFGVRGLQVVVDGIPATLPDGQSTLDHIDIASLGRVEALRGPASALYGNAAGGVLRFETEIPSLAPIRQEVSVVGGTHGLLRVQSTTGGTVGSTGYLVSLNRLGYEGFRKAGEERYGEANRLHLNGRVEHPVANGRLGVSLNYFDLDSENPGSLALDPFRQDPTQVFIPAYFNNKTGKEVQQGQFGVSWGGSLGQLTTEASVYGLTRDFLNPLPGDVVDVDRKAGGARLTLSRAFQGDELGLGLHGGLAFDLQSDTRREFSNDGGQPDVLQQDQNEKVRSVGFFLQGTAAIQERVDLVAGVRYDRARFEVEDLFPVTPGENEDDSGSRTMDAISPTVGVHFSASPMLGLFANYATSFETPTTVELGNREDGSGGFNPDLDPQTGRTFEIGARGTYSDLLSYELTYFNTRLENELIPFENPDLLTYYRNAGSSTRNGAEATLWVRPIDLVTFQATYSRTDAKFDEYTLSGTDLSGKKVPGLAPQQAQASVRIGPRQWYLELNTEYTDEVPVNDSNSAPFAEAYTLFGARVGGNAIQLGAFEFTPFAGVQNLTDETYVAAVAVNAFGNRYYEPGPGRTFYFGGTVAVSR